jgi:large subunit ribosomal protein L30
MIIMAQISSQAKPEEKRAAKTEMNKDHIKSVIPNDSERMFAVVLVRGMIRARHDVKQTLISLRLHRKNACIVRKDTPQFRGMLTRAKDYITWGEIDNETYKLLMQKRGQKDSEGLLKPFFRLNPPRKGFGRKGIKTSFTAGGGLGYRQDKMNDLIVRML